MKMIEDDATVRETDQLDLIQEEDEVLRSPDQQRLPLPLPPDMVLQDPQYTTSMRSSQYSPFSWDKVFLS